MNNKQEDDLTWLARNVHKWPAGDHQPWCYVFKNAEGITKASGNFLAAASQPTMITIDQWLARRAELQGKPSWADAPEWAQWLCQDGHGRWVWHERKPKLEGLIFKPRKGVFTVHGEGHILGDWSNTLEQRPSDMHKTTPEIDTSAERVQISANSIHDWFERGELPPVGTECEFHRIDGSWVKAWTVGLNSYGLMVVQLNGEHISYAHSLSHGSYRPIRTERDELIEIILSCNMSEGVLADAILAAGFRRDGGEACVSAPPSSSLA